MEEIKSELGKNVPGGKAGEFAYGYGGEILSSFGLGLGVKLGVSQAGKIIGDGYRQVGDVVQDPISPYLLF